MSGITKQNYLANLAQNLAKDLAQASPEKTETLLYEFFKKARDKTQVAASEFFARFPIEILFLIGSFLPTIKDIREFSTVISLKGEKKTLSAEALLWGCDISKRIQAVFHATKRDKYKIVRSLGSSKEISRQVDTLREAYIIAATNNSLKTLQELENVAKIDDKTMEEAYLKACESGSSNVVRYLGQKPSSKSRLNNQYQKGMGLLAGVKTNNITEIPLGEIKLINYLMDALVQAARLGSDKAFNTLINSSRFNQIPATFLARALLLATENGHVSIVDALIKSNRFNEISPDFLGKALQGAAARGHGAIVDALVSSNRFNEISSDDLRKALRLAAEKGHGSILYALNRASSSI